MNETIYYHGGNLKDELFHKGVNEFIQDYYNGEFDDERLAEEFGESMFPQATGVYSSELGDILSTL